MSGRSKNNNQKNASLLHIFVGELLKSIFPNFDIRQEYPVKSINPKYRSGREKFDWVILGLKIVVEIMGQQHYGPVCFGGVSIEEAKRNYVKQINRDYLKKKAAIDCGWTYISIKYNEEIDKDILLKKIEETNGN